MDLNFFPKKEKNNDLYVNKEMIYFCCDRQTHGCCCTPNFRCCLGIFKRIYAMNYGYNLWIPINPIVFNKVIQISLMDLHQRN